MAFRSVRRCRGSRRLPGWSVRPWPSAPASPPARAARSAAATDRERQATRRAQILATAGAFAFVTVKSGACWQSPARRTWRPRCIGSASASGQGRRIRRASGAMGRRSPGSCNAASLVTTTRVRRRSATARPPLLRRTGFRSKLSSTNSKRRARRYSTTPLGRCERPAVSWTPSTCAIVGATRSGSEIGASSTTYAPSSNRSRISAATWRLRRVFLLKPTTRRTSSRSRSAARALDVVLSAKRSAASGGGRLFDGHRARPPASGLVALTDRDHLPKAA